MNCPRGDCIGTKCTNLKGTNIYFSLSSIKIIHYQIKTLILLAYTDVLNSCVCMCVYLCVGVRVCVYVCA